MAKSHLHSKLSTKPIKRSQDNVTVKQIHPFIHGEVFITDINKHVMYNLKLFRHLLREIKYEKKELLTETYIYFKSILYLYIITSTIVFVNNV